MEEIPRGGLFFLPRGSTVDLFYKLENVCSDAKFVIEIDSTQSNRRIYGGKFPILRIGFCFQYIPVYVFFISHFGVLFYPPPNLLYSLKVARIY